MATPQHHRMNSRPGIWAQIRALKRFTMEQLRGELPGTYNRDTVRTFVRALTASGHLERETLPEGHILYVLARDTGAEPPAVRKDGSSPTPGSARENLWRTMKLLKSFSLDELAVTAATEEHSVAHGTAAELVRALARVGYVRRTTPHGQPARYLLVRWTGPKPPMLRADDSVFDPNTEQLLYAISDADAEGRP